MQLLTTKGLNCWSTMQVMGFEAEAAQRKLKGFDRITEPGQFRDLSESSDDQKN